MAQVRGPDDRVRMVFAEDPSARLERLPVVRLRLARLALLYQHMAQHVHGLEGIGVLVAVNATALGQGLLRERFGLGQLAQIHQQRGQVADVGDRRGWSSPLSRRSRSSASRRYGSAAAYFFCRCKATPRFASVAATEGSARRRCASTTSRNGLGVGPLALFHQVHAPVLQRAQRVNMVRALDAAAPIEHVAQTASHSSYLPW